MLSLALRASLALSTLVALLALLINPLPPSVSGAAPFSQVLEELQGAKSLRLQLVKSGQSSEIIVRAPGLVRKEETPLRYQIAAGSRLWKIDEEANTVTQSDSPWFLGPDKHVDLLGLMEVGIKDAAPLLKARPYQKIRFEGRDCLAYHVDLPALDRRVRIEAFADAVNHQLVGIVARDTDDKDNQRPPIAELRLIAMNPVIADEKFAVSGSLTEDGRIGKVDAAQGIVVLRAMLSQRWTPVSQETLLRSGDWMRTERRGANATQVSLSSGVSLILGPGTLIELISPAEARLHSGQAKIQVNPENPVAKAEDTLRPVKQGTGFRLLAPRQGNRIFKPGEKQLVRVDQEESIADVNETPLWLAGFEGTTSNESLGSLIVQLPDGRNEPLTVGYHKVSVEIRDQIARTTIEESFVNHTPSRLEGVFHFPLPQDASISGFGMWIGNDLVEADIVEKQRAREIFETILRENRDPGLLEWMGGNLFKARVFPIEGNSEKRIKIVYTQVLPLRANRYRYSYGLRSELLRTRPLRELSLSVTINSALPLKAVSCPTHPVRASQTGHSAQVDFAAQDYVPSRDFEVVCEIDRSQSDVVVIPHRRGADGYFLMQLSPPQEAGNWQRELVADGKPLRIVLLCDTSSSMDTEKRRQQAEFVGTLLSTLGASDQFQLACADVGTTWFAAKPVEATPENIAQARTFLEERHSLGWTDLDRAFADAFQKSPLDAHIIYVGDGIVTAGPLDTSAFVQRLRRKFHETEATGDRDRGNGRRALHSITVGNSYESTVMKGIASVGGGSTRNITQDQPPKAVALELLNELAQPGLRDLNIEFRGVKVAAVYPERLPNLAAGTQQILIGRYLPEGKDQSGEVIVTGLRGDEKVRYSARINLKDAEEGNSFIPRLWARGHLDRLLAQGSSPNLRDEIIALSEEFHIITPYTSLLVLETDADRERFGVKRRFEMRDGEQFFAEGRSNARFDLLQAQMKRAGNWRAGLRRQVLQQLSELGRHPNQWQRFSPYHELRFNSRSMLGRRSSGWASEPGGMPMSGYGFGGGLGGSIEAGEEFGIDRLELSSLGDFDADLDAKSDVDLIEKRLKEDSEVLRVGLNDDSKGSEPEMAKAFEFENPEGQIDGLMFNGRLSVSLSKRKAEEPSNGPWFAGAGESSYKSAFLSYGRRDRWIVEDRFGSHNLPDYIAWVNTLFPELPSKPAQRPLPATARGIWSPEATALSKSLSRIESLSQLEGGIELQRVVDTLDPRWNRLSGRQTDRVLYSKEGWMTRGLNPRQQTIVHFCTPKERGVYSLSFLLGRVRPSVASELGPQPLELDDGTLTTLEEQFRDRDARVEPAGQNTAKIILTSKNSSSSEHFWIDTALHVLTKREWLNEGKVTASAVYQDFVEVAGSRWPRQTSQYDDQGRKVSEIRLDVKALPLPEFSQRMATELDARKSVQFIRLPFVTLRDARQRSVDGSADFNDRLAMILHEAQRQQWDEMWKHVDVMEKQFAERPGLRWIRTMLLVTIRRNQEARLRLMEEARGLIARPQQDELPLVEFILNQSYGLTAWPEFRDLLELLKPVFERQPAENNALEHWIEKMSQCQEALGQNESALAQRKKLAESSPWNLSYQIDYSRRLSQAGQFESAYSWLRAELARPIERNDQESEALHTALADLYRAQGRWDDLLTFTKSWVAQNPVSTSFSSAYAQHLTSLVFVDRMDEAMELALKWINESKVPERMTALQQARAESGLNFALGNPYNLWFQRIDERWFEPLADVARFFLSHPYRLDIAARIINHNQFQQSREADRLRGDLLKMLQSDLDNLAPVVLPLLVNSTLSGRLELTAPLNGRKQVDAAQIPNEIWQKIADALRRRWDNSTDTKDRQALGDALLSIYSHRFRNELWLPFLRERIRIAPADSRQDAVSALFEAILTVDWTADLEKEAFACLRDLTDATAPDERLAAQAPALYRLVDAMLSRRQAAGERLLNDQGGLDKLTRKELETKKAEIRQNARLGLAATLIEEAKREDGPLSQWLQIERFWIEVRQGSSIPEASEFCWKLLGNAPQPVPATDSEQDLDGFMRVIEPASSGMSSPDLSSWMDSILKDRALTTLMQLAVRRTATADEVARILKYLDAGIAMERVASLPTGLQDRVPSHNQAMPVARSLIWHLAKFRLLVGLDRAADLERDLRLWIRDDISTAPWRQFLANLLAEQGKLDEAIQLLESCEKDKLLTAGDYKQLADWYLVKDHRAAYERARIEAYHVMPEGTLRQLVYQASNYWNQQAGNSELDEETLFVFKALFRKSSSPENYFWQLRTIFGATRDFRLLQMLPDSMLGRSPQQIYSFLTQVNSQVLLEVRNEAVADQMIARIKELRKPERTITDLRALDLFEAMLERKSSELLNQPAPHIEACLAALQQAFRREWGESEPRMMSSFLYHLGQLPGKLADEQQREIRELQRLVPVQTRDHLLITNDLCQLVGQTYGRPQDAIREMEIEIRGYSQANEGSWPPEDNSVLGSYIALHESASLFADGESILQKHLAKARNSDQRKWIEDRLMSLYNQALEHDGTVSIGSGRSELMKAIFNLIHKQIERSQDEHERQSMISRMTGMFEIAHRHQVKGASPLVEAFAFQIMPAALKRQVSQYRNSIIIPIRVIADIAGHEAALRYLVERMEQYPKRLDFTWENAWQQLGYELALQRAASASTELEPRVLQLAIHELKRELRTAEGRNQYIYHRSYQYFWAEKSDDFARAAEEVYLEQKASGRTMMTVANYLWNGLNRPSRAIELLFIAHRQGILDEAGQIQLVKWLHETSRFAESINLLEDLIAVHPDNMEFRLLLMTCYYKADRVQQLADLLQQTHDHFHAQGRWTEESIAALARECLTVGEFTRTVTYISEAISLNQRNNPASGLNNQPLSDYYGVLASANSRLGKTREAVDAASAAIVCWGSRSQKREQQLNNLSEILNSAPDLDEYVRYLDREATRTGQDSPILRKAIGLTYQKRSDHLSAIAQLKLAIQLQPHDAEIYRGLMSSYDSVGDQSSATAQLMKLIELRSHELALYQELSIRLQDNEVEAERAATSIIEAAPGEAENNAAMAELRQKQNRWAEAIPFWRQVAELRKLEPQGLLKLTEAQLQIKDWAGAKASISKLRATDWPARFSEVQLQTSRLEALIPTK